MAEATASVQALPLKPETFSSIMPNAPTSYFQPLNKAMSTYGINTGKRIAAFLAQLACESSQLCHTHELWTSRKDFQLPGVNRPSYTAKSQKDYFNYWYGGRSDIGNDSADDGYNYRGRGAIQITGRSSYKAVGDAIGKDLVKNPDLLESDIDTDMTASAYFFAILKNLNSVADGVDPSKEDSIVQTNLALTLKVNGGRNGLESRLAFYRTALKLLC